MNITIIIHFVKIKCINNFPLEGIAIALLSSLGGGARRAEED
jgi:hypothetical protein